jgi:hypothetical protein
MKERYNQGTAVSSKTCRCPDKLTKTDFLEDIINDSRFLKAIIRTLSALKTEYFATTNRKRRYANFRCETPRTLRTPRLQFPRTSLAPSVNQTQEPPRSPFENIPPPKSPTNNLFPYPSGTAPLTAFSVVIPAGNLLLHLLNAKGARPYPNPGRTGVLYERFVRWGGEA